MFRGSLFGFKPRPSNPGLAGVNREGHGALWVELNGGMGKVHLCLLSLQTRSQSDQYLCTYKGSLIVQVCAGSATARRNSQNVAAILLFSRFHLFCCSVFYKCTKFPHSSLNNAMNIFVLLLDGSTSS